MRHVVCGHDRRQPGARSRSSHLLSLAEEALEARGVAVRRIDVRSLPASALMHACFDDAALREALAIVGQAQAVIVATPLYKASYSGLLKTFLDLLPQAALAGKPVLALASGGSLAHLLALDYALEPVLRALGARHVLDNVYAAEHDLSPAGTCYALAPALAKRLDAAVDSLVLALDDAASLARLRALETRSGVSASWLPAW